MGGWVGGWGTNDWGLLNACPCHTLAFVINQWGLRSHLGGNMESCMLPPAPPLTSHFWAATLALEATKSQTSSAC